VGQQVTDADHRSRLEYVFKGNGGAPSLPSLDDLREKVDHARKDVDKLRTQFVCACCDELFPLANFSSHSIEDTPSDLWAVLSDEGVPEDMNQTLRAQYNLTEYNDTAHEEWSSLVISPLSIYDDDGCVSVRLCDGCSSLLATKSLPKLAVRNHLWLGKSPHMTLPKEPKMTLSSLVPLLSPFSLAQYLVHQTSFFSLGTNLALACVLWHYKPPDPSQVGHPKSPSSRT
jgi:hypothetical protein